MSTLFDAAHYLLWEETTFSFANQDEAQAGTVAKDSRYLLKLDAFWRRLE